MSSLSQKEVSIATPTSVEPVLAVIGLKVPELGRGNQTGTYLSQRGKQLPSHPHTP